MGKLVVVEGNDIGQIYMLRSRNILGRHADCSFKLQDKGISGNHCKIEMIGQHVFVITDLNSSNGTFVNNKKIVSEKLKHGDVIQIGKTKMEFQQVIRTTDDSTIMVDLNEISKQNQSIDHCNKPLLPDWIFCPYCGKKIIQK